jgi:hypothetical protein
LIVGELKVLTLREVQRVAIPVDSKYCPVLPVELLALIAPTFKAVFEDVLNLLSPIRIL